jgi:hypothetical protein
MLVDRAIRTGTGDVVPLQVADLMIDYGAMVMDATVACYYSGKADVLDLACER